MARKSGPKGPIAAQNRKARHDYFIDEVYEAGIMLTGTEVKSLRAGRASIAESYAAPDGNELYLINAHIPEYASASSRFNHEPKRKRRLLLHRREIAKLMGAVQRDGMTLVPLMLYFNDRGMVKVELGLARGKHTHDKRESIKARDWERQKSRLMREKG